MKSYVAKKPNESTRQTRRTIRRVFLDLAAELPFNKVSIREICKRTGITRTAFYYHYDDLYSVLDDILCEMILQTCIDDFFLAWSDGRAMAVDVPCKVTMDHIADYVIANDCKILLANSMLSGYLLSFLIAREKPIAVPGLAVFKDVTLLEAEREFRFTFAGIFSIYTGILQDSFKDDALQYSRQQETIRSLPGGEINGRTDDL